MRITCRHLAFSIVFAGLAGFAGLPAARADERHALYVEILGKGGLWGLGYDYQPGSRWALGAAASAYTLDGEQVLSLSPYVAAYPVAGVHHRWFVHLGPQLVRLAIPSPVPEWSGTSSFHLGGEVSSGYELRAHALVRIFAMASVGAHGFSPWVGVSLGWAL